jgi:hemoglobin/transferrin/lactoferrin receptor protein
MSRRNFQFNGQDSIIFDEVLSQVQAIQNLDQAYIYGIQAGIKVELPFNLELSSKINYQKGEEFDGQEWTPLRHAAPLFGSTKLNWKYKLYQLEFFANYNGGLNNNQLALSELDKPHLYAKDKNGDSFYQSWITLNIKGAINISNQFTFFFGFDNLTDIRYITYSSGIVSPGRSVNASLKYSF